MQSKSTCSRNKGTGQCLTVGYLHIQIPERIKTFGDHRSWRRREGYLPLKYRMREIKTGRGSRSLLRRQTKITARDQHVFSFFFPTTPRRCQLSVDRQDGGGGGEEGGGGGVRAGYIDQGHRTPVIRANTRTLASFFSVAWPRGRSDTLQRYMLHYKDPGKGPHMR